MAEEHSHRPRRRTYLLAALLPCRWSSALPASPAAGTSGCSHISLPGQLYISPQHLCVPPGSCAFTQHSSILPHSYVSPSGHSFNPQSPFGSTPWALVHSPGTCACPQGLMHPPPITCASPPGACAFTQHVCIRPPQHFCILSWRLERMPSTHSCTPWHSCGSYKWTDSPC